MAQLLWLGSWLGCCGRRVPGTPQPDQGLQYTAVPGCQVPSQLFSRKSLAI